MEGTADFTAVHAATITEQAKSRRRQQQARCEAWWKQKNWHDRIASWRLAKARRQLPGLMRSWLASIKGNAFCGETYLDITLYQGFTRRYRVVLRAQAAPALRAKGFTVNSHNTGGEIRMTVMWPCRTPAV